jgi:hypothetical protein
MVSSIRCILRDHGGKDMTREESSLSAHLLDREGRVKRWPKKTVEKTLVLQYLRGKLERGRRYTEKEINGILTAWHTFGDHALLRREMFDRHLVNRAPDGSQYWAEENCGYPGPTAGGAGMLL